VISFDQMGPISLRPTAGSGWVMRQVGHADSKMTLDVYAQLEQRIKRDHGASLDRLISAARTRPEDEPVAPGTAALEAV
jgi:integrase